MPWLAKKRRKVSAGKSRIRRGAVDQIAAPIGTMKCRVAASLIRWRARNSPSVASAVAADAGDCDRVGVAAGARRSLEDLHRVPRRERPGRPEARDAAADDRDPHGPPSRELTGRQGLMSSLYGAAAKSDLKRLCTGA